MGHNRAGAGRVTPSGEASPGRRGEAAYHVLLANRQQQVAVRTDRLRRLAARVLRAASPEGGELSVALVDDAAIAELNGAYRGRPRPTDVLSFSQLEGLTPPAPMGHQLGDVVISVETARRQARERGRPLEEEMGALLIHGVLHLLGHDHERGGEEARRMFAREREVAAAIGLPELALGDRPAGRPRRGRRGDTP